MTKRSCRAGVTLIEVLVVLAVTGLIVAMAREVLDGAVESQRRLHRTAARNDSLSNDQDLIRDLLFAAEPEDSVSRFHGDSRRVEFPSWCLTGGGWLARCEATLSFEHAGGAFVMRAHTSLGDTGAMPVPADTRGFVFLRSDSATIWASEWSESTPPRALGIASSRAVIVLRSGI